MATQMFNVRLKPSVAALIRDGARREGVSQGKLLERAVSEHLAGPQEPVSVVAEREQPDPLAEALREQLARSKGVDPSDALRNMGISASDLGAEGQQIVSHQRSLIAKATTYAEGGDDAEWAWDTAVDELGPA